MCLMGSITSKNMGGERGKTPYHPAVNLKSKETVSFCIILVGCIKSSAHPVADHQAADSWSSEEV